MSEITPAKILIVDDVPENLQVISASLEPQGYELSFAEDGESALITLEDEVFDLILLDVMMPGMNGFEVCKRLRALPHNADIPVVFITARTDNESILKGFDVGGVDYVTKPFQVGELLARIRTHVNLRQREKELRSLSATKDRFISIVAHELSGPIGGITGFSSMLREQLEDLSFREIRENITILDEAAQHYSKLVSNLLDWSRLQQDGFDYRPQPLHLASSVQQVVLHMTPRIEEKQLELHLDLDANLWIHADLELLEIVVQNLLSNAMKYSDPGSRLEISATASADWIELQISDHGCGIPEAQLKRLFRLDNQTKTTGKDGELATGLGLILSKGCMERLGGGIHIASREGEGTQATLTLPRGTPQPSS